MSAAAACQSGPLDEQVRESRQEARPRVPAFVTVQPGDSVYALAQRYQVPMQAIIDLNGLEPPYHLLVGQYLKMPRVRYHVVQAGDTVSGIARAYGVDGNALARINRIPPPYIIRVGEWLRLPEQETEAQLAATAGAGASTAGRTSGRLDGLANPGGESGDSNGVKPTGTLPTGPTGAGVARPDAPEAPAPDDGRISVEELATLPSVRASGTAGEAETAGTGWSTEQTVGAVGAARAGPDAAPPETGAEDAQEAGLSAGRTKPAPPLPPMVKTGRFGWPVRGRVLAGFGPQADGQHNDGINIAVADGTPVRAADYGVVAYAGNELRGFGNLVLIRHVDDWITAYGHLGAFAVTKGDRVRRGQVIGTAGQSGAVGRPQLHFEIRRGRSAVDPRDHLSRSIPPQAWRVPERAVAGPT